MSGIDKVECWYDIHYTDNSTEIPPKGHNLSTPDITLEGPFNPSKNREFSEIRLELPFSQAINISYLRLTYNFNNGEDQVLYAWVDDVKLMSDSENAPMVNVLYHIDLWRSYNQFFTYGSGYVVRRPSTDKDLWQNYAYRYVNKVNDISLLSGARYYDTLWWVIVACTLKKDGNKTTDLTWITFPLKYKDITVNDWTYYIDEGAFAPTFGEVIMCELDEHLHLSSEQISGAWLCPMCPVPASMINGSGSQYNPIKVDGDVWSYDYRKDSEGKIQGSGMIATYPKSVRMGEMAHEFLREFEVEINKTSTETNPLYITGPLGEIIGAVPFGKTLGKGKVSLVFSGLSAYIRIAFGPYTEGLVFDYILPSIDMNSNSWSDYVYSGQRDYDMNMRNIQSQSSLINNLMGTVGMSALAGGIANAGTAGGLGSVFEQGVMKGLTKAVPALIGGPAGAIAGALAVGSSLVGPLMDITTYNAQFQEQEDKLHANQFNNVVMSGDYLYVYKHSDCDIHVTETRLDDDAINYINANKAVQGVKYGQNMEDCNDLINTGGPMQITNLIVHGNTPVVAKQWVQNKFAKGVRIVER